MRHSICSCKYRRAGGGGAVAAAGGAGRVAAGRLRALLDLRGRDHALRDRDHGRPHDHLPDHIHVPLPRLYTHVPSRYLLFKLFRTK